MESDPAESATTPVTRAASGGTAVARLPGGAGTPGQPRRELLFAIVALTMLMMAINTTIVATALDALQHGLQTSVNWAGWTITAYAMGFMVMLPVSGRLSERWGNRRIFLASAVVFTVASLLCGFANNIYLLIVLRMVQAVGGAGFTPSATGIIVEHFGDERDRYVSFFGSIYPVGFMLGPIFGGLFVQYLDWQAIFFVNVPVGVAVILLGARYLPRSDTAQRPAAQKTDWLGILLLAAAVVSGMLAASYLGETDVHAWSPTLLAPLLVSVLALWGFFRHIRRAAHPFVQPRLIVGPGFGTVNLLNLLFTGATIGALSLVPLYATNRYGLGALDSGTLLIAQGLAAVVLSVLATLALRRTGYRLPIYVGGAIVIAGFLLLAMKPVGAVSPYWWLAGAAFLIGAGSGILSPASRNAGLQLAPRRSSTLAALRSMCNATGSIIAISLTTAVLAASSDPGGTQAWVYVFTAVVLVVALTLVARVPEHHGAW